MLSGSCTQKLIFWNCLCFHPGEMLCLLRWISWLPGLHVFLFLGLLLGGTLCSGHSWTTVWKKMCVSWVTLLPSRWLSPLPLHYHHPASPSTHSVPFGSSSVLEKVPGGINVWNLSCLKMSYFLLDGWLVWIKSYMLETIYLQNCKDILL